MQPCFKLGAALIVMLVTGCERYSVSLNGQTLYTPKALFSDFVIADPGLSSCVKQTILDGRIERADQLTALKCTYAGIERLEGLEVFSNLQQLDLRHNRLKSLAPIKTLAALKQVDVRGNSALCAEVSGSSWKGVALTTDCQVP